MKQMQKIACLLLALLMVLSLGITAFAAGATPGETPAEQTGSITISNAAPGETYKIYRILDLKSYNKVIDPESKVDVGTYSYKVNEKWGNFFATNTTAKELFTVSDANSAEGAGYVKWKNSSVSGPYLVKFTQEALKYAIDNGIQPEGTHKIDGAVGGAATTYTFENLKLGYYLLDSTVGTLCTLSTTNPNVTVNDKNTVPKNTKTVAEGGQYGSENDAAIGDTLNFTSTIEFESGAENFKFHDQMSAGLTFVPGTDFANVVVILDPSDTKAADKSITLVRGTHYNVVTEEEVSDDSTEDPNDKKMVPLKDGCTFHIEFLSAFYTSYSTGEHKLAISYKAMLNANAVTGADGNTNTSRLNYGDVGDVTHDTPDSTTKTKTWEVPVYKYTSDSTGTKGLDDTHFILKDVNKNKIALVKIPGGVDLPAYDQEGNPLTDESGNPVVRNWPLYRVATEEEEKTAGACVEEIVTDSSGRFRIKGLDSGTYYLEETQAKKGYNKLDTDVPIIITATGEIRKNETAMSVISIQNNAGSVLPDTGGIGTTIFYVVGSVLLIGAGILLVTKKRMSAEA